jgi:putative FmdB family regulatory protein
MPKYVYECSSCHARLEKFANTTDKTTECPECSAQMNRQLPRLRGYKATEVLDKYTNKKHIVDQDEIVNERKQDYYWKHEVPKMVDSGTYTIETMLEQGWVYFNEKNELVTRTKPPGKE